MQSETRLGVAVALALSGGLAWFLLGLGDGTPRGLEEAKPAALPRAPERSSPDPLASDPGPPTDAAAGPEPTDDGAAYPLGSTQGQALERLLGSTEGGDPTLIEWSGTLVVRVRLPDGSPAVGVEVYATHCVEDVREPTDGVGVATLRCSVATNVYPAPKPEERETLRLEQRVGVGARCDWGDALGSAWESAVRLRRDGVTEVSLQLARSFAIDMLLDQELVGVSSQLHGPGTPPLFRHTWKLGRTQTQLVYTPGSYRAVVLGELPDSKGLRWATGEVEVGDAARATLHLRCQPLAQLDVSLLDASGAPSLGWLQVEPEDGQGEWELELVAGRAPPGRFHRGTSPFANSVTWGGERPIRLNLPPGGWRLTALGTDAASVPTVRTVQLASGEERSETLRLELGAVTQVSLPANVLEPTRTLQLHLGGPPGASLAAIEGGVRVLGLARGMRARLVVVSSSEDEQAVGWVELHGGTNASVQVQRPGGLEGRVAGVSDDGALRLRLRLEFLGGPSFPCGTTAAYADLLRRDEEPFDEPDGDGPDDTAFARSPYDAVETEYVTTEARGGLQAFGNELVSMQSIEALVYTQDAFGFWEDGVQPGDYRFEALVPGRYRVVFHDDETDEVLGTGPEVTIAPAQVTQLDLTPP